MKNLSSFLLLGTLLTISSCSFEKKYSISEIEKAYIDGWDKGYNQKKDLNTIDTAKFEYKWDMSQKRIDASFYSLEIIKTHK